MRNMMEPRPPDEDEKDDDRCPKCAVREWEICMWLVVVIVALYVLFIIVLGHAAAR